MTVRRTILLVVLSIVATPFFLLAGALAYEGALVGAETSRLFELGRALTATPEAQWPERLRAEAVWVRKFDGQGALVFDSHSEARAQLASPLGSAVDLLLPSMRTPLALDVAALTKPPLEATTVELDGGRGLVVRVPMTTADQSTIVLDTVLRRGIRQLVLVRVELAKLIFLQTILAVLAGLVLGRRLVRPLEALAAGARTFPRRPIADPALLERSDELGEVARELNALVSSLDARWKDSVLLAGELTHELKNPLATIAAASERLASAKELTPEKRAEWTRLIGEAVTRLQHSTDALLGEVKTAARTREAQRTRLDYRAWLGALLDGYRQDPRWAGWTFELEVESSIASAQLDPEGWKAALTNLIDNALVQPPREHRVRLEVRRLGPFIATDVIDFGPGVSEGNRDKIFQRFFTQRPGGVPRGTGLGLSIVQAVAEAHGGSASLQPADAARGACFRITAARQSPEERSLTPTSD